MLVVKIIGGTVGVELRALQAGGRGFESPHVHQSLTGPTRRHGLQDVPLHSNTLGRMDFRAVRALASPDRSNPNHKPLKHSKSVIFPGRGKRLTSEKKTAGVIGDRQRIAVLAVSQREFALVIGAPELIGSLAQR